MCAMLQPAFNFGGTASPIVGPTMMTEQHWMGEWNLSKEWNLVVERTTWGWAIGTTVGNHVAGKGE